MGDEQNDDNEYTDGFEGYEEKTNDPGIWLLLGTTIFCVSSMLFLMPMLVCRKLGKRKDTKEHDDYVMVEDSNPEDDIIISARNILNCDKETWSLLKLTVPFTISSLTSTVFSTLCFIIISHNVTTMEITAYAIVCVLVGLTDGILYGPISACTTLCAHAVGAGNVKLAGTYLQLAVILHVGGSALVVAFWWFYMYEAILWLEWGDEETALIGQAFIRHYLWNYILTGISSSLWQLLEIAENVKGRDLCWHSVGSCQCFGDYNRVTRTSSNDAGDCCLGLQLDCSIVCLDCICHGRTRWVAETIQTRTLS